MKNFILFISLLTISQMAICQDIITTQDSKEIEAKIIKINAKEIEYKKWANMEGPTYVMSLDYISHISYQNGHIDSLLHATELPQPAISTIAELPEEKETMQEYSDRGPFQIYIKGGFQYSKLDTDWVDFDFQNGFHVGFGFDIPLYHETMFLQPEMKISRKGFSYDKKDINYEVTYFEIPIRYTIKPKITNDIRLSIGLGTYFAVAFSNSKQIGLDDSYRELREPLDFGVTGAVGLELYHKFLIGMDVDYGFVNIWNDTDQFSSGSNPDHRDNYEWKGCRNYTIAFSIGYKLTL